MLAATIPVSCSRRSTSLKHLGRELNSPENPYWNAVFVGHFSLMVLNVSCGVLLNENLYLLYFLVWKRSGFDVHEMLDTILIPTPHVSEKPAEFTMLESIFISSCPSCLTLRFQSGGGSNACHSSSSMNMILVYQHDEHIKVNIKVLYTASSLSSCNSWNINVNKSQKTSTSDIKPL